MKFQSVDVQGPLHIERLDTKPNWEPSDEGRLIYVKDKNERVMYYGSNEGWVRSTGFGFKPVFINSDYTAESQDLCMVDTRNGPIVITLPANPKAGAEIRFIDVAGSFESNPTTIHRNDKYIQRLDKNLVLDINDFTGTLAYDDTIGSWKVSIEGVTQVVGTATIFVHKEQIVAQNIDGSGGQKQFTFKFKYNPQKDNIAVFIDGVKQYTYDRTNPNSITFDESVKEGSVVEICTIPIEAGYNIDKFANKTDLENYLHLSQFTPLSLLEMIKSVDGQNSGLDADTLDERNSTSFVYIENYKDLDVLNKIKNVDGHDSGLDADTTDTFHALQDISKDKSSVIPVTRSDGKLDPIWLPFGRGGFEFDKKFDIIGNPTVVDLLDLNHPQGYLIQLNNITPSDNDVKLYLRFYDEDKADWTGADHWTINFSNHLSGGLRDFNTASDMLVADHIGNGIYGLSGWIYLSGFGNTVGPQIKTIRSDLTHLSSIESFASLSQSVGTFNKTSSNITGMRIYFNRGLFSPTGYISILKVNERN